MTETSAKTSKKRVVTDVALLQRLQEICSLGCRPPVLRSLFPTIPEALVTHIWIEQCGRRPPRGPLPYTAKNFLNSPQKRLEAAIVIRHFIRLRELGHSDIDALIGTYHASFSDLSSDRVRHKEAFTFDRVWFIYREYTSMRSIVLIKCPRCGVYYAHSQKEAINHDLCPMRIFSGVCVSEKKARRTKAVRESSFASSDFIATTGVSLTSNISQDGDGFLLRTHAGLDFARAYPD
jgi:hypothetical protein